MTYQKSLPYLILMIALLFFAYRVPNMGTEKYNIDKKESVITYRGSMKFDPRAQHIGYVYISKGELLIEKDQLVGGMVEIDMNTLADKDHGSDNDLVNHLKSADFFDVKKFPTSTFAFTKVEPAMGANGENIKVTGSLTIKGITNTVTFPARLEGNDGNVQANGKLIIDRTLWDVRYNSGKYFPDLGNEIISDSIEFQMKIVAKK